MSNPNLQQIPSKRKDIKKFFISSFEGGFIVQADLSQAELRILAIESEEPFLIKAYKEGRDIHREVAGLVLGKPTEEVADDERQAAKQKRQDYPY
jgi:DNA polymerase-1